MNPIIRPITQNDKQTILSMMETFYNSPAVYTNGSIEIFKTDIDTCLSDSPFLDGFVIENLGEILGYTMVAKSFSTEFGKPCIWVEDLYIKDGFRGAGLGNKLLEFITQKYKDCIFRLEVEEENQKAIKLYQKHGFTQIPYMEMKK